MKSLSDIDIKIMLCKTAFEWELLAKKYDEIRASIEDFFGKDGVPEDILNALESTRASLVEKRGATPPSDLVDLFK